MAGSGLGLPQNYNPSTQLYQQPYEAGSVSGKSQQAPPGYSWDATKGTWVPTVDSAENKLSQQGKAMAGLFGAPSGNYGASGASPQISLGYPGATPTGSGTSIPRITGPAAPPSTVTSGQSGTSIAREPTMAAAPGRETLSDVDFQAANAAEFARAKDQIGLQTRGALTGLSGAMAGRGITGSGVAGRGIASVVNQGAQGLSNVTRQQAITGAEMAQKNAEANFQGGITQRAQDMQRDATSASLGVTQRGQDMSAEDAIRNALITERGQNISLAGQEYSGGIAQRGQDIGSANSASDRALQALIAQMTGGITQRGQDLNASAEAKRIEAQRQAALTGIAGRTY